MCRVSQGHGKPLLSLNSFFQLNHSPCLDIFLTRSFPQNTDKWRAFLDMFSVHDDRRGGQAFLAETWTGWDALGTEQLNFVPWGLHKTCSPPISGLLESRFLTEVGEVGSYMSKWLTDPVWSILSCGEGQSAYCCHHTEWLGREKSLLYIHSNYKVLTDLLFPLDYKRRHMVFIYMCICICTYVYVLIYTCRYVFFHPLPEV